MKGNGNRRIIGKIVEFRFSILHVDKTRDQSASSRRRNSHKGLSERKYEDRVALGSDAAVKAGAR